MPEFKSLTISGPIAQLDQVLSKLSGSPNTKVVMKKPMRTTFEVLVDTSLAKERLHELVGGAESIKVFRSK